MKLFGSIITLAGLLWLPAGHLKAHPKQIKNVKLEMKVLNNLVTELLHTRPRTSQASREYRFTNPRDGWVFFSSTADTGRGGRMKLFLDAPAGEAVILHKAGDSPIQEAMRFLPKGEHRVSIRCEGRVSLKGMIVRAIPELVYCKFGSNPQVSGYGAYDHKFLQKYVLKNVNCMVGSGDEKDRPFIQAWKREGKKWIIECGVPGLTGEKPVTVDEAYTCWSQNIGLADPLLDGVIADEFFGGNDPRYRIWTEALRRIQAERLRGKTFYPYCGTMYEGEASLSFIETVLKAGSRFALERYLPEQPTPEAARSYLDAALRQPVLAWEKAQPGAVRGMIICFGHYISAPPESIDVDPGVDFKVYMDMQFHLIANDPAFSGLFGVMEYTASYSDEEIVRWAGRLYRHYCIEGKREMLSPKYGYTYNPGHILNPDFAEGTTGWTLSPAAEGGIATKSMKGYSWLQGRYPETREGDAFLWMKRSPKGPNIVSQEIKGLKPGRLYSLKMFSGDYRDLSEGKSVQQKHALSLQLENVELLPGKCFHHIYPNCYSHHLGSFNDQHRAWMNYHVRVFRAKGKTAKLAISDWAGPHEPGGPAGQELMLNFIEVQPYHEF